MRRPFEGVDLADEFVDAIGIAQKQAEGKVRALVALVGALAGQMHAAGMAVEQVAQLHQLARRARPVKVEDEVVTVARTEIGEPKVDHQREYDQRADNRGGELLRAAPHADEDGGEHERGVQRVAQDVAH